MFSFKRAGVDEIPEIQQIAYDTWPSVYSPILGEEQVSYMLDLLYSKEALTDQFTANHYFYFVYLDNDLVGFASFGSLDKTTWKLHKIYILPSAHGCGAGKSLLDFCFKKIISLGGNKLLLNVNRQNKARIFYEKLGFVIVEEADLDIGSGFFMNDYVMRLNLPEEK